MNDSSRTRRVTILEDELRRLKHLQKTRMLSLDDGGFVRGVVDDMQRRIAELEAEIQALSDTATTTED